MMRRRGPSLLGVVAVSAATQHVMNKSAQGHQAAEQQAYEQGAAAAQQQSYEQQAAAQQAAAQQEQMAQMQAQMAAMQAQQAPAVAPTTGASDVTAQLTQLAQLKDQGIITQEEFDAKKKQLLGI